MNRAPLLARVSGVTAGFALALALTGCFSNPIDAVTEGLAEEGAEKIVEGIAGEGTDFETGSIPEEFPSEIPLVSENVVSGVTLAEEDGTITTVIVEDSRSVDELTEQVKSDFADWEQTTWLDMDGVVGGSFTLDDTLTVTVSIFEPAAEGEGATVSYMASEKTP